MALAFGAVYAQSIGNNNTTRTTTMPSTGGPADGALLIGLLGTSKGSLTTHTAAAGFSAADIDQPAGGVSSDMYLSSYHKTASSEAGVGYVWSTSPAAPIVAAVLGYTGQDPTTPIPSAVSSHDTAVLSSGVTTPKNSCYVGVLIQMENAANTVTAVSDAAGNTYSIVQLDTAANNLLTTSGTNDVNLYYYHALVATAGSTGAITATVTGTTTNNVMAAFVVQPSGGSTGVASSDSATVSGVASISGNNTTINATDSATVDDSTSDLSINDGTPDFTVTDVGALQFSPSSTDSATLTDSSSVATTIPTSSDLSTVTDVSQITVLGSNPTSSDLFTIADVGSLGNNVAVDTTDLFALNDESLAVEVGFPSTGRATVSIVSPRGTVTLSEG